MDGDRSSMRRRERRAALIRNWEGNNVFLCEGRLMLGPDTNALTASVLLISAPSITYLATVGVTLGQKLSWAFEVMMGLGYVVTMAALAATSCTDPGIVPRKRDPADPERQGNTAGPLTKEYHVNGRVVKTKYCITCKTFRPPRCSHCRICDNCVEKFDHHCPWVGTCIGKRNYRHFLLFVLSATFLCMLCVSSSIISFMLVVWEDPDKSFWDAVAQNIPEAILSIYGFVFFWFVGGLLFFHTYLLCTNHTTYEHFRAAHNGGRPNPYNVGIAGNCHQVLCVHYESLLDEPLQSREGSTAEQQALTSSRMVVVRPQSQDVNGDTRHVREHGRISPNLEDKEVRIDTMTKPHANGHADLWSPPGSTAEHIRPLHR